MTNQELVPLRLIFANHDSKVDVSVSSRMKVKDLKALILKSHLPPALGSADAIDHLRIIASGAELEDESTVLKERSSTGSGSVPLHVAPVLRSSIRGYQADSKSGSAPSKDRSDQCFCTIS